MKHLISVFIISFGLIACSEEINMPPGISFLTPDPEILEETAIFRVVGQPFSAVDSVTIPISFGGTAQSGTDYIASADHFTFSSESLSDSVVISTKQLGTKRTLSLSLQIPEGFTGGKYTTSEFILQDKYGSLNFPTSKCFIADTTEYTISLCDSTGAARVLSKDSSIEIAVNLEKSTAIEGEDFMFIDTTSLVITGGKSSVNFSIAPIGDSPKEGHDKLVLSIIPDSKFDAGDIAEMELNILKKEFKILDGKWKVDSLWTDSLYFQGIWGSQCSRYDLLPKLSKSDEFEISFNNCDFSPRLRSELKYYFTGNSDIAFDKEIEITDLDGESETIQLLSLDNTNRYFSEVEASEDSLSFIGVHLFKNQETDVNMLDLYILDHTSRSFMPELESGMKYQSEKPVATEPGTYLKFTFRKL